MAKKRTAAQSEAEWLIELHRRAVERSRAYRGDPEAYEQERWEATNAAENTNCDDFDDVGDEPWEIDAILD